MPSVLTRREFLEASALAVGAICLAAGFLALVSLEETFHKDLDYFEEFL